MNKKLVALAVLTTFPFISTAAQLDASSENIQFTSDGTTIEGVNASNGYTVTIDGEAVSISSGIRATTTNRPSSSASSIIIGSENTKSVTISTNSGNAISTNGSDLTIHGKNIVVTTISDNLFGGYGEANIGGAETDFISFTGGDYGLTLLPYSGGASNAETDAKVTLSGKTVKIEGSKAGLWAQNNSTGHDGHFAKLTINADDIFITSKECGVVSMSQGDVELNGNTFISAPDAILARGDSKVNINK
ncbi:MAG: hypothetical protein MRZ56_02890, partial [Sutterella sp.]|nr:hypothetical protein [Sutterella sp.]